MTASSLLFSILLFLIFSKPTMAFSYITPTILEPGATDEDMLMKQSAIVSYLAEMEKVCNV